MASARTPEQVGERCATIEKTQTILDRKYSELCINYEILQEQLHISQWETKQVMERMEQMEQRINRMIQDDVFDHEMIVIGP